MESTLTHACERKYQLVIINVKINASMEILGFPYIILDLNDYLYVELYV